MHAAVVHAFDRPPRYEAFPAPEGEHVVDVLAAALHPRVRSAADGTHYESTGELPLIPGIDGVGRTTSGELVYFVLPDTLHGSMAERVAVDPRRCVVLPGGVDPAALAALMNPAMSSWIALRKRIAFEPGQHVLVLGATGSAGRLAVQLAKHLGAGAVFAAGRNRERLAALGVDRALTLDEVGAAADVDVVLDYLWGEATALALPAILKARTDRGRPLTWVEIGSMAGLELQVPSAWLRAARLQLVGSGQGSVSTRDIVGELPALAAYIAEGGFTAEIRPVPLSAVEATWLERGGERVVFMP